MQQDNLDFKDHLALLFHIHRQMKVKTVSVAVVCASADLNIHKGKTKIIKFSTTSTNPTTLDEEALEKLELSIYLGSIIDEQG